MEGNESQPTYFIAKIQIFITFFKKLNQKRKIEKKKKEKKNTDTVNKYN